MLSFTTMAVSNAEANAYVTSRLLTGWPVAVGEQNAALRRGQDYIAREYNPRWIVSLDDINAPDVVKYAIVEAALIEARSPNSLSPIVTPSGAKVLTEVKGIKWTPVGGTRSGALNAIQSMKPVVTSVEGLLTGLVRSAPMAGVMVL